MQDLQVSLYVKPSQHSSGSVLLVTLATGAAVVVTAVVLVALATGAAVVGSVVVGSVVVVTAVVVGAAVDVAVVTFETFVDPLTKEIDKQKTINKTFISNSI